MNIHSLYGKISPYFRNRRLKVFIDRVRPSRDRDSMLDVGGYPWSWSDHPPLCRKLDVLNVDPFEMDEKFANEYNATAIHGDACHLDAADGTYDIVYSNSVIEHVGTWENQVKFASEARRAGGALWIQTPAQEFFIEPHYIAPFIHWFPIPVRRRLVRWFTPWGWMTKPDRAAIDARLNEIRLINRREMDELFPDCEILREKFLGLLTKSYIAYRPRGKGGR